MTIRHGAMLLAAGVVLGWGGTSRAEFRTVGEAAPVNGFSGGAYTMSLELVNNDKGDADTVDVHWRRWGYYRPYYYGGYGYRSFYRPYYAYRPYYFGYSYYRPYYYGYNFYRPYYYPYSYYYYSYSPFYCYINLTDEPGQPATQTTFAETYRYDGGPANPVPLPAEQTTEARTVSLPVKTQFAYPAYGERTERTGFAQDRK